MTAIRAIGMMVMIYGAVLFSSYYGYAEPNSPEAERKNMTQTINRATAARNSITDAHTAKFAQARKEEAARIQPISKTESALRHKPVAVSEVVKIPEPSGAVKIKKEKMNKIDRSSLNDKNPPPGIEKKKENPPKGWDQGKKEGWKDDAPPGLSGKFKGFFGGSKKEK